MNFLKNLGQLLGLVKKDTPAEKPAVLKKRTMKLVSKKEMVDLGVTKVLLKFSDGRELITNVYGNFASHGVSGNDETSTILLPTGRIIFGESVNEPTVSPHILHTSKKVAEEYISNITNDELTYVDCSRVPTKSEVGKVKTATIISTHQHLEEVTKYSVEKI